MSSHPQKKQKTITTGATGLAKKKKDSAVEGAKPAADLVKEEARPPLNNVQEKRKFNYLKS